MFLKITTSIFFNLMKMDYDIFHAYINGLYKYIIIIWYKIYTIILNTNLKILQHMIAN